MAINYATHTFTLKQKGKELPARFGGLEVTYRYPADLPSLDEAIKAAIAAYEPKNGRPKPTLDQMRFHMQMGQSGHMNIQKAIKVFLKSKEAEALGTEAAVAEGVKRGESQVVQIPGVRRGEGQAARLAKAEGRAQKAEAKEQAAAALLEAQYLAMSKNARGAFAARLLEAGIFTKERLAELDAQK